MSYIKYLAVNTVSLITETEENNAKLSCRLTSTLTSFYLFIITYMKLKTKVSLTRETEENNV